MYIKQIVLLYCTVLFCNELDHFTTFLILGLISSHFKSKFAGIRKLGVI